MEISYDDLRDCVTVFNGALMTIEIDIRDIVFEKRVKINCFYCDKYNSCWTCPPRIPNEDYQQVFEEYSHAAIVYGAFSFDPDSYSRVRTESSLALHRALLKAESHLLSSGNSLFLSFIGGSCKLCKTGCGKDRCNQPYMARIPLEATGVNVVSTLSKYDIRIVFPVKDELIRAGLVLW